jgi:hypothetical protein
MIDDGDRLVDAMAWPRRGGLWRRLFASLIDYLVVLIPIFSLVAALYLLTDGGVKGSFWLNWRICQAGTVHGNPSLAHYDWQVCKTSVFGFPVADWAVGTSSQSGEATSISMDLDPHGNFRPYELDLGFLDLPVLAIYLFVMELTSGQAIGKRVLALVVHDDQDRHRVSLPLQKAVRRQAMKFLGVLPVTLSGVWFAFRAWGYAPGLSPDFSRLEIVFAYAVLVPAFIWPIWIALSVALGNEPIHDRFAGTTVRVGEAYQ